VERGKKVPFRRPIRDGKHYLGKRPAEFIIKSLPEIDGGATGVIGEGAAAPSPENKRQISVCARNSQHAMNPPF
jgi:hypothetical protein